MCPGNDKLELRDFTQFEFRWLENKTIASVFNKPLPVAFFEGSGEAGMISLQPAPWYLRTGNSGRGFLVLRSDYDRDLPIGPLQGV